MRGSSQEALVRCAGSWGLEQPGMRWDRSDPWKSGDFLTFNIHEMAPLPGYGQSLCWFSTTRNEVAPKVN